MALYRSPSTLPLAPPPSITTSRTSECSTSSTNSVSNEYVKRPLLNLQDFFEEAPLLPGTDDRITFRQRRSYLSITSHDGKSNKLKRHPSDIPSKSKNIRNDETSSYNSRHRLCTANKEKSLRRRGISPNGVYSGRESSGLHRRNKCNDIADVKEYYKGSQYQKYLAHEEDQDDGFHRAFLTFGDRKHRQYQRTQSQIRLTKPSERDSSCSCFEQIPSFSDLSGCDDKYFKNKRGSENPTLNYLLRYKSSVVGQALTHTVAYSFSPLNHSQNERQASGIQNRRISATLQVVRSRESVYGVIWEDKLIRVADQAGNARDIVPHKSKNSVATPEADLTDAFRVETRLSSWSWHGEHCQIPTFSSSSHTSSSGSLL